MSRPTHRNVLAFDTSDANGSSFTLRADGQALAALIGGMDHEVPLYLVRGADLPRPTDADVTRWVASVGQYRGHEDEVRLVGVCSCGEQGCGCTVCRVRREGDAVVFRDFLGSGIAAVVGTAYRFSLANYQAVVAEIAQLAGPPG